MTTPAIEQFEREYAARSGTTVEYLHANGRFGAPCDCGDERCEGFQMMHIGEELVAAGWTPPAGSIFTPREPDPFGSDIEPDWNWVERTLGHAVTEERRAEWEVLLGHNTNRTIDENANDLCECSHKRIEHIYYEGACRPGSVCPCWRFRFATTR